MNPSLPQIIATIIFALALIHTFSTSFFERLAHRQPKHAGIYHLLGEVEIVFGFWAGVLFVFLLAIQGRSEATNYLNSRNYTEPLFVFVIMIVASSRPILDWVNTATLSLAQRLPLPPLVAIYSLCLIALPLLGSLITEPAAMTLAALILGQQVLARRVSLRFKYLTIAVLFVNISIGGTLTSFAAPPVLMVARTWEWNSAFMFMHFGYKAILAIVINTLFAVVLGWREFKQLSTSKTQLASSAQPSTNAAVPFRFSILHMFLLLGIIFFAHDVPVFIGIFLLFMGLATAYPQYQNRLMLREALLVAFFLGGLVVLGGLQSWWLQPLLLSLSPQEVFLGATLLTGITDNAALTYLGSLIPGLSDSFKYFLVAGAVAGGGLTVIANAPNLPGLAILRSHFPDNTVKASGLLGAAIIPTIVAAMAFYFW